MLKMCLNPKVIAALAAVGVGVYLLAPNLVTAALPLLILAVCPLSMLLMGRAMMGEHASVKSHDPQPGSQEAGASEAAGEEVRTLRAQVESMSEQQAALQEEIERLRQQSGASGPKSAVEEAEDVAADKASL